ncbi:terminase small subunit [Roseospira marina]|uniref:terminase small subunit n=1 Tax=Roseospira marina TaxID=140057 RepID=UPI001478BCDD|nr:terminase small subunit [Roseospira marina]MBB4314565.1 phage terminase small subunit [Roseospira marina]MBB5088873.1 phage terminase small subunit [Roseospira marina]
MASADLNDRQRAFCEEYLVDLNATQAAIRAGYAEDSAAQQGWALLRNPKVFKEINRLKAERRQRLEADQDAIIQELTCLAMYDAGEIAGAEVSKPGDIGKLPEHIRRAIVGWKWDRHGNLVLDLASKTAALDLLGKHLAMWIERVEHGGTVEITDTERAKRIAQMLVAAQNRKDGGGHAG